MVLIFYPLTVTPTMPGMTFLCHWLMPHPYFMSHSAPYAGSPGNGQHGDVGDLSWRLPPPDGSVSVDHLVTLLRHQPVDNAMNDPQTSWTVDQLVPLFKHTSCWVGSP